MDAFVARLVGDKGARLSASDVRSALERERRAGEGWAAKALAGGAVPLGAAARFGDAAGADGDGKVAAEEIKRLLRRSAKE